VVVPEQVGAVAAHADESQLEQDCIDSYNASVDEGVTFFDTAEVYAQGQSEEVVGRALQRRPDVAVAIATKFLPMPSCLFASSRRAKCCTSARSSARTAFSPNTTSRSSPIRSSTRCCAARPRPTASSTCATSSFIQCIASVVKQIVVNEMLCVRDVLMMFEQVVNFRDLARRALALIDDIDRDTLLLFDRGSRFASRGDDELDDAVLADAGCGHRSVAHTAQQPRQCKTSLLCSHAALCVH
jgi:hypothetical protein